MTAPMGLRRLGRAVAGYPTPAPGAPLTQDEIAWWNQVLSRRFRWYGALAPRRHACPVCGWRGWAFMPMVAPQYIYRDSRCPRCLCHGRHRALACYLNPLLRGDRPLAVLDVAGVAAFRTFCERHGANYVHANLSRAQGVDVVGDLTRAPFAHEAFDIVVCYHVLEHIRDDRAALREIARLLRKDGRALIQVPWHERPKATVEFDEVDRLQHGHVRVYGEDLPERIAQCGLQPAVIDAGQGMPEKETQRFGIAWSGDREIIVCTKQRS